MNNHQKVLLTYKIKISLYDASFSKKSSTKIYQVVYVYYNIFKIYFLENDAINEKILFYTFHLFLLVVYPCVNYYKSN